MSGGDEAEERAGEGDEGVLRGVEFARFAGGEAAEERDEEHAHVFVARETHREDVAELVQRDRETDEEDGFPAPVQAAKREE
jgi:hypothetical protein